jgi:hypothetical protein
MQTGMTQISTGFLTAMKKGIGAYLTMARRICTVTLMERATQT